MYVNRQQPGQCSTGEDSAHNDHHEKVVAGEAVSPTEDVGTMNMNDEDESNAWVPPDDKCSKGNSSSYVSDYGDDVPCLPFNEAYDAMEYNNDEVCVDEKMNCTNAMETEISAIT